MNAGAIGSATRLCGCRRCVGRGGGVERCRSVLGLRRQSGSRTTSPYLFHVMVQHRCRAESSGERVGLANSLRGSRPACLSTVFRWRNGVGFLASTEQVSLSSITILGQFMHVWGSDTEKRIQFGNQSRRTWHHSTRQLHCHSVPGWKGTGTSVSPLA